MAALDFADMMRREKAAAKRPPPRAAAPSAPPRPEAEIRFPPYELARRDALELERFTVGAVARVFYVPDWISAPEEAAMLRQIRAVPAAHPRWTQLRGRRLQCWGGRPDALADAAGAEPLPPWLRRLGAALVEARVAADAPDHALLNEYRAGDGILPHTDGPAYAPRTATLSLGSSAVVRFTRRVRTDEIGARARGGGGGEEDAGAFELVLRPRSLLVFEGDAYAEWMHGIDAVASERVGPRVVNGGAARAALGETIERGVRHSLTLRRAQRGPEKGSDETEAEDALRSFSCSPRSDVPAMSAA